MHALLIFTILISFVWAHDVYNGQSLIVNLPSPTGFIRTDERTIDVLIHPVNRKQGIAILPIDYHTSSGEKNVTWEKKGESTQFPITVYQANYPVETLSVDPSKVIPPPEALERIEQERIEAETIYRRFTPIRYWNTPFIKPLDTFITSLYGAARTYNGTLQSYHGGVDFRARTPIPIQAANDGIVVLAKDRYYAGGTIIIDHGEGIYSCYFHLSRYDVNVGDYVEKGQNIALSGATGRITGPHLHFGIMVHGVQSDPLDLIEKINALFNTPQEPHETYSHQ